ncbi:hypothetical protein B0H34DRAFT_394330 [Crassisporium funariophilum]|nr:hypothetical protein B0H34DRAFT_394330 [Crassisporium funariophilum]
MTLLHDLFNTRNLQGFQRLLNDGSSDRGLPASSASGAAGSSYTGPGGKSWTRSGGVVSRDINARDRLGRTALHLACSSLESIEYVRALLKHPQIDVNIADTESHWTPLHRTLYAANLPAALLLLQHADIDPSLKDLEGYTAYDLYNSTVNGTKPNAGDIKAELFTWGANRNAALGVGDGDDRTYPDHVNIKSKEDPVELKKKTLVARFSPIGVKQIQMSKLHTAVVTSEHDGNVRLCGFGSGGRLGPAQHTQYKLQPLPNFTQTITSVALGQDHTLALTKSGEVFSWGLNRFSQLGYLVEASSSARHEEPIQAVPKRVMGFLRREVVLGVAAAKKASACWTKETVYTWGTNTGQLGYDKAAQPVQVYPRPVTKFTNLVVDVAMNDTVLAGLLITGHVECIWNDGRQRISFPMNAFPSGIQDPYRPPQSVKDSHISKITSCDETFAALSFNGEVFTFSAPPPHPSQAHMDSSSLEAQSRASGPTFKPQRVWALRKTFSAVKDVALSSDGSIIICTESGHVFVRTRNATNANSNSSKNAVGASSSGKTNRFERVPYLQRVVRVCANSTGAYGALRVDWEPRKVEVVGNVIERDMKGVQPYLSFYRDSNDAGGVPQEELKPKARRRMRSHSVDDPPGLIDYEQEEDVGIEEDISGVLELCNVLVCEQRMRKEGGGIVPYEGMRLPDGADTMLLVQSSGAAFPVHRAVLAARSGVLLALLSGSKPAQDKEVSLRLLPSKPGPGGGVSKTTRLSVSGCHPLTVLIFLWYLYSDELLAVWDRRIGGAQEVEVYLGKLEVGAARVRGELKELARVLELPLLAAALESPSKRVPGASLANDMTQLFDLTHGDGEAVEQRLSASPLNPDVVLQLADRDVYCHSVVLRARTPLFKSFFGEEDWTAKRWGEDGRVRVDLRHMRWGVMEFVLKFMLCGTDAEMFHMLDFVDDVEGLLKFMFEVLSNANELLLDRLVLLCSSVILDHATIHNACYILADATHYHASQLVAHLQEYITINLESFLESRLLDDIPYALVKQLSGFVRGKQAEKAPYARDGSEVYVREVMEKYKEWLEGMDVPEPFVRTGRAGGATAGAQRKETLASSKRPTLKTNLQASAQRVLRRPPSGDDIFAMDEPEPAVGRASSSSMTTLPTPPPAWKASTAPRVDMKAVLAEAASQSQASVNSRSAAAAPRTPQSDLRRTTAGESPISLTPTKTPSKSGTPLTWRSNLDQAAFRSTPPGTPPTPSAFGSSSNLAQSNPSPAATSIVRPQAPPSLTPVRAPARVPGMGPVITPMRQIPPKAGSSSSARNVSGGKVWTAPPIHVEPVASPATSGMSFVAIQYAQQEQVVAPVKDKRSLREIQEEEQARQVEADFLTWWSAEEVRMQEEAAALARFQDNLAKKAPRKPRNTKESVEGKRLAESAAGSSGQQLQNTDSPTRNKPRRQPRKPSQKSDVNA